MQIFLETERLVLRPLTPADAEHLCELDSDPAVMRFITGGAPAGDHERYGRPGFWAAVAKSTGAFLGWFEFRPLDSPGEVELGYRLHSAAWGRGYATEGARALIHKGFTELGVERVVATTMTVNTASRRVMEKAGLSLVRTFFLSWPEPIAGSEHGDVEYALTKAEWERRNPMQTLIDFIKTDLRPRRVTSDEALYQYMESQSNYSLAIVYKPFDANRRYHWSDHGRCLDYLEVLGAGDLLDVGPGDGWPSLPVAFHARSVTGLDASAKRIEVCTANARRLGLANFRGVAYEAGTPLPFADATFDGVMASSSLENSPDPRSLVKELCRVLRPGGKLRMHYESPRDYAGGKEQELHLWKLDDRTTYFYLADRHLAEETVDYYSLILNAPLEEAKAAARVPELLKPLVREAMTYSLSLPGCRTWTAWLREAGFSTVSPTHDGGRYGAELFDRLAPAERPADLAGVEALLRPGIRVVVGLEAPADLDPMITAVK
ncbi:MAG TPA: GNAT family N-acetyltransferase [Symbiobacteriaceae bacterium]|nr:GNAT family N-acetyltransferase [Symbiobacteriaceae bacterium]